MTEIEKLYENAGFKKDLPINLAYLDFSEEDCDELCLDNSCDECRYKTFPPFTEEKQLKLIEFFISSIWWENLKILYKTLDCSLNFGDKLAKMINYLWLSLCEEERKQIKEILE